MWYVLLSDICIVFPFCPINHHCLFDLALYWLNKCLCFLIFNAVI